MAEKKSKEVLEVGVDINEVIADMAKMQRATTRSFGEITKAVDKLNKANSRASDDAEDGADRWEAGLEDLTKAYKNESKEIEKTIKNIELLHQKFDKASKDEKVGIKESIDLLKKRGAMQIKALRGKERKEGRAAATEMFKNARGELKDALKDTISSVFSKDLKGIVEGSAKTLVKGLKLSAATGLKLGHAGGDLKERGKARGGAAGLAMQAGGAGMKGIGNLMGGIKPVIEGLSKMGPILGMIGTAVIGIVKLFLDLDAKVKEFNKDILQSASNAEFLAQAGGNTTLAFYQMKDTLDGIRDAAYDLSNIQWGISPDQFKGTMNTLNQEGVSLNRIGKEAADSGKTVKDFTLELGHMSVAYSRAFGVPLQEINQLQAELMTEMGNNLGQTRMAFQQMIRSADDSGIAANKFFAIIRGVSQDLSLWSTRMEDAVKLLGRLGQVMNPRNAQKFMQTATQGLKNMSRTERLRLTLLTGQGKMGKLIDRDIKRKAKGLADQFGMSADEIISKVQSKEGRAELESKVKTMDPAQQGALREALIDAQLQVERKKKGTFGEATAARNLGPAAALQAMQGALQKFGGGKRLSDIVGTIGGEMMAENLGISEEQLDQMAKFEASIDNQREVLKKQLASGDKSQQEQAKKALKQAGIEADTDEELRKKIDGAGYDEIMDTLSDGDKKLLNDSAKVEDLGKKQADLQTSILDKLGMLVDFLMNQLYNIFIDIADTIAAIPGVGKSRQVRDTQSAVYRTRDNEIMKLFEESHDDMVKFRNDLIMKGGLGKGVADKLDKYLNATDPNEKVSASFDVRTVTGAIDRGFSLQSDKGSGGAEKALKAAGGVTADQIDKIKELMEKGDTFSKSMAEAGLSEKQRAEAMKKSLWFLDPSWLANLKDLRAKPPEQGSKTDQAASAAKSANTGQPGGGQAAAVEPTKAAPATPPAGGGPAATPQPMESRSSMETAQAAQDNLKLTADQASTLHSIDNQMDAFKMDTGFLSGPYSKAVENSVLSAVRTALFEYYMYKDLDKTGVVNAMASSGFTPRQFSQAIGQGSQQKQTGEMTLDSLTPHATGGVVTGVNNGLAMVTAAAGEGLTSIGPGERIVPSRGGGGGGNTYNINVQGVGGQDLARIIEAKVVDGVHEYKRRERFTP